ncbi:DUF1642 domain-containing protein [Enterococcus devriesei]|uniref:DUF1642 domain-containing protein n=1 Tax=Enterococcus devriesei TaxID=319970 RepID=UPI001C1236E1|nr:DUF1642 domain-containing protein [Enterococcus devriesei]MBU5366665.1 DUF1642 domain-containing protein [Enterococcus devriesei]
MSKKVLIDKQALIDKLMKIPGIGSNSDALKTIKRFPSYEPQKIKVPEFVAKWFETNKYVLDRAILDYMFDDYASDNSEFGKWFDNKNGKPIETLVRMLDGYEVEEDKKYYVALPLIVWDDDAAILNETTMFLAFDITSDETRFFHSAKKFDDYRTELTESEIKSIDERYWPFAVPVEKV